MLFRFPKKDLIRYHFHLNIEVLDFLEHVVTNFLCNVRYVLPNFLYLENSKSLCFV